MHFQRFSELPDIERMKGLAGLTQTLPDGAVKFLNMIFRDPQGPGNYNTSNKYWYNFGSFDENGRWIINKNYLLERLVEKYDNLIAKSQLIVIEMKMAAWKISDNCQECF